jgi:hypothetical protein
MAQIAGWMGGPLPGSNCHGSSHEVSRIVSIANTIPKGAEQWTR